MVFSVLRVLSALKPASNGSEMFAVSDVLYAGLRGVCSEFVAARLLLKSTLYVAPCHGNDWFIEVLNCWVIVFTDSSVGSSTELLFGRDWLL